jgi:hypothetical protein
MFIYAHILLEAAVLIANIVVACGIKGYYSPSLAAMSFLRPHFAIIVVFLA